MGNDKLHARIRFIREALGLTQEQFAEKAGISYKYYQSIETGRKKDIRLSTLEKLGKACNVPASTLLNYELQNARVAEMAQKYGS